MTRVVIHDKGDGFPPFIYADGEVEVIWVCDFAPDDRFYRAAAPPIPDELRAEIASAKMGHADDGSSHQIRANVIVSEMEGRPHLSLVSDDGEGAK